MENTNSKVQLEKDPDEEVKPKYSSAKQYKWEPSSTFCLSGQEFGTILNTLRSILNSPEGQRILMVERAHFALENSLSRAVDLNEAVEIEDKKR